MSEAWIGAVYISVTVVLGLVTVAVVAVRARWDASGWPGSGPRRNRSPRGRGPGPRRTRPDRCCRLTLSVTLDP